VRRSLAASATDPSSVVSAPASPKPPRFFDGKKLKGAGHPAVQLGPVRLGGVLEHLNAAGFRQLPQFRKRRGVAEDVDRDQRPGAIADRRIRGGGGHAPGLGVDVAEDGGRAEGHHGLGGGEEGERGDHHLVARADAQRAETDLQRVGPIGEPDAVLSTDEAGELGLERLDLRAEDVAAALEDRPLAIGDLGQQRLQRRAAGEQRQGQGRARVDTASKLARSESAARARLFVATA
jgi:hypothetical protein